ncbi:fluoride efflux transporter CrcB [Robertmurraya massiliosenegalensis]|uniref:fluoride efflux transporter CrcB n=1 Tax=Robertmurraya TaxID=2837507 RepID=UPI0039A644BC
MIMWGLVAVGGFFGAISRFSISNFVKKKKQTKFPIGTLIVNLVGSFFLGYLFAGIPEHIYAILGVGFLGAFTTFSTMNVEAMQLLNEKRVSIGILYLSITYFFGVILAICGYFLAIS